MIHLDTDGFLVEKQKNDNVIFIYKQEHLNYYRIDKYFFADLKLKEVVIDNYIYFDLALKYEEEYYNIYNYRYRTTIIDYYTNLIDEDEQDVLFFNCEKEPWLNLSINGKNSIKSITDPLFSKINLKKPKKNIIIIEHRSLLIQFGAKINDYGILDYSAIIFKNVRYEHNSFVNLNQVVDIYYEDFTLLTKSVLRGMKINNLVLDGE
jgi:hypothetical protein